MMFWQLTIDANEPAVLARFWTQALGYQPVPPAEPATTWHEQRVLRRLKLTDASRVVT